MLITTSNPDMNEEKRYIGVYYPDAVIENRRALATFCLFFDEIHLVTMADLARDPTDYLNHCQINCTSILSVEFLKN